MVTSTKVLTRQFYACPHCGHIDPNAIDYILGTYWRLLKSSPETCFKCKKGIRRSPRTFLAVQGLVVLILYPVQTQRALLLEAGINEGLVAALELLIAALVITAILLLPRLVFRWFGLQMYEPVSGHFDSSSKSA